MGIALPEVRLVAVGIRNGERRTLAQAVADHPVTGHARLFVGGDPQVMTNVHSAFGEVLDVALDAVEALADDKGIDWVSEPRRVSEMTGKG